MLNEQFFFTTPVQVVKVTNQNLQEVADWCGGLVAETESRNPQRKAKGQLDPYVSVPVPQGSKIGLAFVGMYVTKRVVVTTQNELKITWSVFVKPYFEKNYFETPDAAIDATWAKKDAAIIEPTIVQAMARVEKTPQNVTIHVHNHGNGMTPERLGYEIERLDGKGPDELVGQVLGGVEIPKTVPDILLEEISKGIRTAPKLGEHDGRMKMSDVKIPRDAGL